MEIHRFNASLNWDGKHKNNPWDISDGAFDVAVRCYPTEKLQIPISFLQLSRGRRAYDIGIEYQYNLYVSTQHQGYRYYHYLPHYYHHSIFSMDEEEDEEYVWEWNSFQDEDIKTYQKTNEKENRDKMMPVFNINNHTEQKPMRKDEQHMPIPLKSSFKIQEYYDQSEFFADLQQEVLSATKKNTKFNCLIDDMSVEPPPALIKTSYIKPSLIKTSSNDTNQDKDKNRGDILMHQANRKPGNPIPEIWDRLAHYFDIKSIQGIIKFHFVKPWKTNIPHMGRAPVIKQVHMEQFHKGLPIDKKKKKKKNTPEILVKIETEEGKEVMVPLETYQEMYKHLRQDYVKEGKKQSPFKKFIKSLPHMVIMNHSSMFFGKNKIAGGLGYDTGNDITTAKLHMRRKYTIGSLPLISTIGKFIPSTMNHFDKPIYFSTSFLSNVYSAKENKAIRFDILSQGYRLRYKHHIDKSKIKSIQLGTKGWYSIIGPTWRGKILTAWKYYARHQDAFVVLPPAPRFEKAYYQRESDAMLHRSQEIIYYTKHMLLQISKILRYLIDMQVSTVSSTLSYFFSPPSFAVAKRRWKSAWLGRTLEQIYILSCGFYSKSRSEVSWQTDRKTGKKMYALTVPIEWHWGCDLFRFWVFVDLYMQYKPKKYMKDSIRHQHSVTIALTLFDVYTLFTYTYSLHPLLKYILRKLRLLYRKIKNFFGGSSGGPTGTDGSDQPSTGGMLRTASLNALSRVSSFQFLDSLPSSRLLYDYYNSLMHNVN
mmetsp:Transcript_2524/g.3653  ORF Transcript_2524/g.3653 Transcript_2524/m.3653 type:complete len:761 (+) Transcript_2524:61-2343(+)